MARPEMDYILVPLGLIIMVGYHLWLFLYIFRHPSNRGGGVQTDHERLAGTKFFSILLCFLVAFLLNVQSVRYYSHASVMINVPEKWERGRRRRPDYVASLLDRGTYCWSLGLRACYFSFPLFLWIFSAVAMVACCVAMVVVLYFLDVYMDWGEGEEEEGVGGV
ncbi:uncharacterized protein LOC110039416 [Phalaenopsis equestris]|uniref:uncharacterized protein LOC110039416 n=1 Tax=Phalaenopsis equestris TaxID=78828 RepID=UPI0009E2FFD2|nr:uncharacterized protein LOC110039416 [Phalaenopsis equestris]